MQIQCLGAARQVTGSCHLITIGEYKLLLDCGLVQGSVHDEQHNFDAFPFEISSIDALILSHAHIDHSGRIPLLVKRGYRGKIYTHAASRDLCSIMLRDAAYLNERETEWENRKRERKGLALREPLYSQEDAEIAVNRFSTLAYSQAKEILPGITLTLHDAGHILGSAIVELHIQHKGDHQRLIFSGDIGHGQSSILHPTTQFHDHCDLVMMESTYGNRTHRPYQDTVDEFAGILKDANRRKGNIIIPAFAVGRTQELLYLLATHATDWDLHAWHIFLDSPMAIEATRLYQQHAHLYQQDAQTFWQHDGLQQNLPNLHFCKTSADSMALNKISSGAIIIAGSGMCTGGRIKHHLKHHIWQQKTQVIITGFQAMGTPGRALVDGAKYLRLWGESIQVNAKVHTLGGFSAHADQQGLLNWYQSFPKGTRLALVHGEDKAILPLAEQVQQRFAVTAYCPQAGDVLNIPHTATGN